jgi:hypothetical protein
LRWFVARKRRSIPPHDPFAPEACELKVDQAGYRWEGLGPGHRSGGVFLRRGLVAAGGEPRRYNPLAVPGLFRDFAETPIKEERVLAFANRYGELGVGIVSRNFNRLDPERPLVSGEAGSDWEAEILEMRAAVHIWDALASPAQGGLEKWIVRTSEADAALDGYVAHWRFSEPDTDGWHLVVRGDDGKPFPKHWLADFRLDIEHAATRPDAAWCKLISMINGHLSRACSPFLEPRPRQARSFSLRVSPSTLLSAMWWQFARVITGEAQYHPCRVCGRLIERSTGDHGVRADTVFCSNACKFKDHRARVRRAKELRAKGRTVRQIAKELETSTDAAKNWIAKKK